ncbi:MAG: methionine--tRNA ligase [Acidiferrobacteraceae bacterium]
MPRTGVPPLWPWTRKPAIFRHPRDAMSARKPILVTSALPYANGPIHIGHLVEYIQTDIWVRFQKMLGNACTYVCADDAHGTPIMLRAQQEGVAPETLIERVSTEHRRDFADFRIGFDWFHSTHSEENRQLAEHFYRVLRDAGHTEQASIRQPYDPVKGMFLPDRFIRGECPRCGARDQYGDGCEACGATYDPADLRNPVSAVSGTAPVWRESEHYFFRLGDFSDALKAWTRGGALQDETANKLDEWLQTGLRPWDISRDTPYFGFEIPDAPGKYFYVWLDAPLGYIASFWAYRNHREHRKLSIAELREEWNACDVHHFIGKDILYFHALFWPAMLDGAGFHKPKAVHAHGFLTVNGQKMSKSRGTFIMARTYLNHFDPEQLRYYIAAKLNSHPEDIDLNLDDFAARVNSDLVGKIVNIGSRCAGLLERHHDNVLGDSLADPALYQQFQQAGPVIAGHYAGREFGHAIREIMALADLANQYIDRNRPWDLARLPEKQQQLQAVCTEGLNLFRTLVAYLKPVLPRIAADAEAFLRIPSLTWESCLTALLSHKIATYQHLMTRVSKDKIMAMNSEIRGHSDNQAQTATPGQADPSGIVTLTAEEFAKVDLRIARIADAQYVEGADKLLRLTLDLGHETRQVFAGLRAAYEPETLKGRLTVMVANLAPRKMRFGVSEGMVLAAGPGGKELFLLSPDSGATPGMKVK